MIAVIDYGMGNIGSICNIIERVGGEVMVLSSPSLLSNQSAVILPGVGAFDDAMNKLESNGWTDPLKRYALTDKRLLLGICLGMQLLTRRSEEGIKKGLGLIEADTIRFDTCQMDHQLKVPHMGWNLVEVEKASSLFNSDESEERFYFVHSYHVICDNQDDVYTSTYYGYKFASSIRKDNIIGVQFHPEKSHKFGRHFFSEFVKKSIK